MINPVVLKGAESLNFIDTLTGEEGTRIILSGAPDLGEGLLNERAEILETRHAAWLKQVLPQPGVVGALLVPPNDPHAATGVLFFHREGILPMCGHGTLGVVSALHHLGRLPFGNHFFETAAGLIPVTVHSSERASFENIACFCWRRNFVLAVPEIGEVVGNLAWGGNWFYIVPSPEEISPANLKSLKRVAGQIQAALQLANLRGSNGQPIQMVQLIGSSELGDSRNFVTLPDGDHDRSPCGTGTSAFLACLVDEGKLRDGGTWVQQGFLGDLFRCSVKVRGKEVFPRIEGRAKVVRG